MPWPTNPHGVTVVNIVDLADEHLSLYFVCLEDWSDEMKEAGDHKARWYAAMKERGLRVKVALDDAGVVGGMIHYVPIRESPAEGEGLYFINCIWVHGHKQGRGDFRGKGMGSALLDAAEADVKALGAEGMAAWGLWIPVWMKASWFKKHDYFPADRIGIQSLVWKPFRSRAMPPRWIRQKRRPLKTPGRVTVTSFVSGWCPAQNMTCERARRAALDIGGKVVFEQINTLDRNVFMEWGISDALFIDGKEVSTGPPPTYEKIRKLIARKARAL